MLENWVPKLTETIKEKTKNGGFKRGELSKLFISLAEEFGEENPDKLKNYYYRVIKKELESDKSEKTSKKLSKVTKKEKLDELILFKEYPGDNFDIQSFRDDKDPTLEWLNFSQVEKNITGKSFKEYVDTLNSKLLSTYSFEGKEIEVIEKELLLKTLTRFSDYTRHKNASTQAEVLAYLLEASDEKLNEIRTEKYFDSLKYGDKIQVRIAKIMHYGAMVHIVDYPSITGMIHISEIKNGYVEDISLYFEEEQILDAKLLHKKEGMRKLAFSTKDFRVPLRSELENNLESIATTPSNIKEINESQPLQSSSQTSVATLEKPKQEIKEVILENPAQREINFPDEWKEVSEYVKSFVGPLSPEAKSKLKELIQEFGLFKFSLGINDATKDFKNDLGLILLSKAETKLRDGL